ncbi:interactor of constitutive active ROPs 2, chloroplastic-like protein [Tanacetum coccineum]|uniref:Interactor of constitutive active ROPs 2, chloroplastic-like protein n=1 Tax=Tanacetum coccineum TaxID=301880 RepID=A0ABQ5D573_9ASTR
MSEKLQESEKQLDDIQLLKNPGLQELRKILRDRDREWESELESVQKHHSMDSAALASVMNEIQKLKIQLEKVSESKATQAKYADSVHDEMLKLRLELSEILRLKSNARADSLEGLVSKLEAKDVNPKGNDDVVVDDQEELNCVKIEVEKLCSQFVGAEKRYQSTLQIRSAYELVEQTRSESGEKVSTLEANLE